MTEIAKKEEYNLISDEDFDFLIWFDEQKKRAQVLDEMLKKYLEENKIDNYTQTKDGITIHAYRKKPYKKKQVDTKMMKEEGVYDIYTKEIMVKGSTVVQVEYE